MEKTGKHVHNIKLHYVPTMLEKFYQDIIRARRHVNIHSKQGIFILLNSE
jgi:hypothetical protein